MKTDKIISVEQLNEEFIKEHSGLMFEKKSAKLFVNVIPKSKVVSFSVFFMKTHKEEYFDDIADALSTYNYLP